MKFLINVFLVLFSIPTFACINLSGVYEKPTQQQYQHQLDLTVVKQDDCNGVGFYDAWIDLPTNLYMENPNPVYYRLDGTKNCNAFGSCYTAVVTDKLIHVSHDLVDYKKVNGETCSSETVSFGLDTKKSLHIVRDCNDGSKMEATYKIH